MEPPSRPQRSTLPRARRITKRADFALAYAQGSRARGSILVVVARPNGLAHPRLGLSVGRAIWPTAVGRNRVKRMFREAFRLEQGALTAGFDLVLIPAAARLEPQLAATRSELVRLSHKAARRCAEKSSPSDPPGKSTGREA